MRVGYIKLNKPVIAFPDYGKGHCKYCGKEISYPKRFYCNYTHGFRYNQAISPYAVLSWATFRDMVLRRDNHKCVRCGGEASEVHHKIPVCKRPDLEFTMDNCESLCFECHTHKGLWGRKNIAREKAMEMVRKLDSFVEAET